MSTPIEQMILDAKRLANRLKEKESLADVLMNDTTEVNYQLDSMRQFQDDLNALNILARERSNQDMIHVIHQENPQIREIQQENRQLKASIEDHQRAIELIMTKYRQHTQQQIKETQLDFEKMAKANENNNVSCVNYLKMREPQFVFLVHNNHQLSSRKAPRGNLSDARRCSHGRRRFTTVRRATFPAENREPRFA